MSYQVLARKWRPRCFSEICGQHAVVKALSFALSTQRLHHAYLFTGTRGVGKTTLARLLAKALNCETGISATPCLTCSTCLSIEKGEFIDLIEIDAASRTRVEDTRDLLDNVPYMPSIGRYKVYLIDEVHMLSQHSFNALLKTLEEPPEHVIFILATTDPERLPVTVLSRCFQCHLKPLNLTQITAHLSHVLTAEQIPFESAALLEVARAAEGSMRDALSLLDQVIALGEGEVKALAVMNLLGGISTDILYAFIESILTSNAAKALDDIQSWLSQGFDFNEILDQLIEQFHALSVRQLLPSSDPAFAEQQRLASLISKEEIQLYYQICLHGKRDLPYAPTPRLGFEMTVIRLLAFSPSPTLKREQVTFPEASPMSVVLNKESMPAEDKKTVVLPVSQPDQSELIAPLDWEKLLKALPLLTGAAKILAEECAMLDYVGDTLMLMLPQTKKHILTPMSQEKLTQIISTYYNRPIYVKIALGESTSCSPAELKRKQELTRLAKAKQQITEDVGLQSILTALQGTVEPDSIQPIFNEEKTDET